MLIDFMTQKIRRHSENKFFALIFLFRKNSAELSMVLITGKVRDTPHT